jgi:hypothetical protein
VLQFSFSFSNMAIENSTIVEHSILPLFSSIFREACSWKLIAGLDREFQWILRLSQMLAISESELATVFVSACSEWPSKFAEPNDSWFDKSSKSREDWVRFLLHSRNLQQKMHSIRIAIPKFAEHGRTKSLKLLLNEVWNIDAGCCR